MRFDGRAGHGLAAGRQVSIFNVGSGTVNWRAEILAGREWLSIAPATGSATPVNPNALTLTPLPGGLGVRSQYALVRISDPQAVNSPRYLVAVLNLGRDDAAALPDPSPQGLVFVAQIGGTVPTTQRVVLFTSSSTPVPFQAAAATADGAAWLSLTPATGTTSTAQPAQLTVAVSLAGLRAGVYWGDVTIAFSSTQIRTVNVTLIVLPSPCATARAAAGCTPSRLSLAQTGLVNSFSTPAGWPVPLSVRLTDDCGDPVAGGQMVATFSNGDPALPMRHSQAGVYAGTWTPVRAASQLTITARATAPGLAAASVELNGAVTANRAPVLYRNAVLNNLNPEPGPLAPGTVAQIYGSDLARAPGGPDSVPLPTSFQGTQVLAGGIEAPLFYVSGSQINAQLPAELAPGREHSILVAAGSAYTTPDSIFTTSVRPGIAVFSGGRVIAQRPDYTLVTDDSPARPGDLLVLYLVGMGATQPIVASGAPSPGSPLAEATTQPTVTIGGRPAEILFAGLTPFGVGLYQINLRVPAGVTAGELPVVITQGGVSANAATLPVRN